MHVAFVFTNYNNSEITIEAINSVKALESAATSYIVIIDNDSREDEKAILRSYKGDKVNVQIVFSDKNLGYFSGLNYGLEKVYELLIDFDYIIIGNNDLIFPKDFLHKLYKSAGKLNSYPVISPNIITLDGVHQNPHVVSTISKAREVIYDIYYSNYYLSKIISKLAFLTKKVTDRNDEQFNEIAQPIYQGYGACYILTRKFVEEFKLLWAPTFMMSEEFFLSVQLEKKGYKTFYEPSIIVKHHCHATMGQLHSKFMWQLAKDAHKEYRKYVKIF